MSPALDVLPAIGLGELEAAAALQHRRERKYVLTEVQLDGLLAGLVATHAALEIGGTRSFRYRTTYYDTPDLRTLRDHVQNRRRRFKLRKRRYEDSGRSALEVKLKGLRGQTVKVAAAGHPGDELGPEEAAFLVAQVQAAYGQAPDAGSLAATLTVTCCRATLVCPGRQERVTIDRDLQLGGAVRLAPGLAVVESKSEGPSGLADGVLRLLGVRPVDRCSKYCIGLALARPDVPAAPFRAHGRWFEPLGDPAGSRPAGLSAR